MDAWLEARRTPLALALLAVAAVGAALWIQRASDYRPLVVAAVSPTPPASGPVVYVSGEVARPGVYLLQPGDRAEQAIAAAGGSTAEADLSAVNLAVRLKDEQQVHVPRKGEAVGIGTAAPGASTRISKLVNVNTADVAELELLPKIGPVTAQRIVDYRTRNGPFGDVEDLKTAKLVSSSTYEAIEALVTVR